MAKLLILVICGFLPGTLSQCSVERAQPLLKRSAFEFAVQLTSRIAQEKENHFVASTLSVWTLLATASLGADGVTLQEFQKVLKLHKQKCFNDRYFELLKQPPGDGTEVSMERSSTIFVADGTRILDRFRHAVQDAGISELAFLSFDDPESVAVTITEYVSRATHYTINDILTPTDLEGVYLIMIDAIYFKGLWQKPFPELNTEMKPFYDDLGSEIGQVNMMRVVGGFRMSRIDLIDATVLELPFGSDGRHVMLVFLPRGSTTLSAVIDSLMRVSLTTVYKMFERDDMQTVSVEFPRFSIASDLDNLKELLSDMGLKTAFDSYAAQFPNLSDEALYISNVIQKASVEVTEAGAEASASSAGFLESRFGPDKFEANKPFLYMIVDTATQVPLFTGAYSKPSLH